jgi:hypothetical protein
MNAQNRYDRRVASAACSDASISTASRLSPAASLSLSVSRGEDDDPIVSSPAVLTMTGNTGRRRRLAW